MSLEAAIQENTDTMKQLIAVWNKLATHGKNVNTGVEAGDVTAVTAGNLKIDVAKATTGAPTKTEAAAKKQEVPAADTATAQPSTATDAGAPVTYDQVAKAITEGVKTSREKVVAALAKFGAKKGTELKADQYADFLAELA